MPFLIVAHLGVVCTTSSGGHVAADGFSPPYFIAMASGTATCAFGGLFLAFRIARNYFGERGLSGHVGHMVRQSAAGLHVFQSVVFARRIYFQRVVVYFLLGQDPGKPQRMAVDRCWVSAAG